MKRFATLMLVVCLFCFMVVPAGAIVYGPMSLNANIAKQSVSVGITNATSEIAAAVTGETTYICGMTGVAAGTTPKIQVIYGTKTTTPCDTGVANLTGAMLPTSGLTMNTGVGGAITNSPVSKELCISATGSTTAKFNGVITYIQQ